VPDENAVRVLKQFQKLDDGRRFIIESVGWEQIEPQMRNLPTSLRAENSSKSERREFMAITRRSTW